MTATSSFGLDREVTADGRFVRQESVFRRWVTADPGAEFPVEAGRYHLYVSLACPWSHRAVIVRVVKGLDEAIGISLCRPVSRPARLGVHRRTVRRTGDAACRARTPIPSTASLFCARPTRPTDPGFEGRVTVPVLWDKKTGQIVSNESSDIVRMFNDAFDAVARRARRPLPGRAAHADRRDQRVRLRQGQQRRLQGGLRAQPGGLRRGLSRAVRGAGRARGASSPSAASCSATRSPRPTGACSPRSCASTPSTTATSSATSGASSTTPTCGATRATSTGRPGIAATVAMDQIKRHYYTTHDFLNPSRIIPDGPAIDFAEPTWIIELIRF